MASARYVLAGPALRAYDELTVARRVGTVDLLARFGAAVHALANVLGARAKGNFHALVKNVALAFPMPVVA